MGKQTRREFLVSTAAAGGALGMAGAARGWFNELDWQNLEKRRLGKTELRVRVLGFGGAEIGYNRTDQDRVTRLLNTAIDQGLDAIDTAECYADSEVAIANAVSHRRDEYALFTKVGHYPRGAEGWTAAGVMASIERSLERLKTDHVDVVHLHSCSVDVLERGEVIDALEKAKAQGKTRHIGYSGDSKAAKYAVETGRFETLMTSISFCDQEAIDLTLPLCRERDMGVIVKRGIANAVWRYDTKPDNRYVIEYWNRMNALDYDFTSAENRENTGPDGPAGIALRFVLGLPGVHTTVVGTTNPARYAQNAALIEAGPLEAAQVEAIRARWREVAPADWVGQI